MNTSPKISVVVPIHASMENGSHFLWRLVQSVMIQSFKDYELIIVQEGSMPENTNAGMRKARGELIKILFMDDYLAHEDALKNIAESFQEEDRWLATGCLHQREDQYFHKSPHSPHVPEYAPDILFGNNRIGSPSVVTLRNEGHLEFDENLSFFLDCELYHRYHEKYGDPRIIEDFGVVIGIGGHQTSNLMPEEEKLSELEYIKRKYA